MPDLVLKEEVYLIIGAAMEVYYQLGRGFLEPVYQEALQREFSRRGIPAEPRQELTIYYKDEPLRKKYFADFVCYGVVLIELKALHVLTGREEAQLLNYMKATRHPVGLLINFGSAVRLEFKRYVYSEMMSPNQKG